MVLAEQIVVNSDGRDYAYMLSRYTSCGNERYYRSLYGSKDMDEISAEEYRWVRANAGFGTRQTNV